MIVVKIFQGPGNQFFQIAFGLAAAARLKTQLKIDLSWFNDNAHHRQYILDRFMVNAEVATKNEIYDILTCNAPDFISYRWNRLNRLHLRPYYQRPKVVETVDKFDMNFKKIIDKTYVEGYFTSLDFFDDHLGLVKEQLKYRMGPDDANKRMIDQIKSENAVALSFRLGDFLKKPWQNVTSLEYYRRSINYLAERHSDLRFYAFSDDIKWVKENFKINHPILYMDHNSPDYMEDFRLLTNFRLHIIPNSTFSWWGALLADDNNKMVLCPEYWLNTDKSTYRGDFGDKTVDFSRALPDAWIKIPNIVKGDHYIGQ